MDQAIVFYNESLACLPNQGKSPGDDRRAFALNMQAAAQGYHDAILAVGWFYLNGRGIDRDLQLAARWFQRSARLGEPKAMFNLGLIFHEKENFVASRRWFRRAAKAGHVRSLYWLGKFAWRGWGSTPDRETALSFFRCACHAHHPEATRILRFLDRGNPTASFA